MEIKDFLTSLNQSAKAQNPTEMLQAMHNFFSKIHSMDESGGQLLGLYSTAQQFEQLGFDSKVIKQAVRARIASQYAEYPNTWRSAALALNSMLAFDQLPLIEVKVK